MMLDGDNDGCCPPRPRRGDVSELAKRYPAAALYIRADSYEDAHHWAKAAAGREAKALVIVGDLVGATAKLENWLEDHGIEMD
jgi:hypothetical protein